MANNHLRPQPLPPGVYFNPTWEESMGLLNRWIAGDKEVPDARGYIFFDDVYRAAPHVLTREYTPSSSRAGEHTWWFLSETRFQSKIAGGGTSKRADRSVTTGGYWVAKEIKKKKLRGESGFENGFGFYLDSSRKEKTPWLMQEFTTAKDGVACKKSFPALGRVYVTPRATVDELREIYGEDGVPVGPDGKKKPVRAKVPAVHLNAIAALLPPSALRRAGQGHVALPPPPPPLPGQSFMGGGASPTNVLGGQYQQQQGQFSEAGRGRSWPAAWDHVGFLEASPPLPPPASPGLPAEVGEDAPSPT